MEENGGTEQEHEIKMQLEQFTEWLKNSILKAQKQMEK